MPIATKLTFCERCQLLNQLTELLEYRYFSAVKFSVFQYYLRSTLWFNFLSRDLFSVMSRTKTKYGEVSARTPTFNVFLAAEGGNGRVVNTASLVLILAVVVEVLLLPLLPPPPPLLPPVLPLLPRPPPLVVTAAVTDISGNI